MEFAKVPHFQTWAAMEALVDRKLVRNIGVCNYNTALFADLLNYARIPPAVIQVERHPYNTNSKLVRLASEAGVVVVGFSPLGASSYLELGMSEKRESVLANKTVQVIAGKYGKTPAQVVLRWALDTGCGVVPKTVKAHRMSENIDVFDFKLTQLEMEAIAALNIGRRFNDPGHFCQAAFNTFCPIYD